MIQKRERDTKLNEKDKKDECDSRRIQSDRSFV